MVMLPQDIAIAINPIMDQLKFMVGGIFGLYLILVVYKILSGMRLHHIINMMRKDMQNINIKVDLLMNKNEFYQKKTNKTAKKKKNS